MSEFSKLTWLKRTNGHKFKGAEFRVLIAIFNASDKNGRNAFPGVKRLMAETGLGRQAISEAITSLKTNGWIEETHRGSGTSGSTSVFDLIPDAPKSMSRRDDIPSKPPTGDIPPSMSPPVAGMSPTGDKACRPQAAPTDPLSDPRPDPKDLVEGINPLGLPDPFFAGRSDGYLGGQQKDRSGAEVESATRSLQGPRDRGPQEDGLDWAELAKVAKATLAEYPRRPRAVDPFGPAA
jgi:hypothetical protein